jgi:hypothetical protein
VLFINKVARILVYFYGRMFQMCRTTVILGIKCRIKKETLCIDSNDHTGGSRYCHGLPISQKGVADQKGRETLL